MMAAWHAVSCFSCLWSELGEFPVRAACTRADDRILLQVLSAGESTDGRLGRPTADSDVYCQAEAVHGFESKHIIGIAAGAPKNLGYRA